MIIWLMKFYLFMNFLYLGGLLILMLVSVAFLTLFERKILGYIQDRKGPNKVGFLGILQPFSDVIKLLNKEFFLIDKLNYFYYYYSAILILVLIIMLWILFMFIFNSYTMNMGILYLLSLLSLGVYPIMLGGWSSNSNYSMLGCLRSVAQSVSFEVSLFLIMFIVIFLIENYSFYFLMKFNLSLIFFLFPIYLMFIVSMLIEMNRTPFDLVEGESELVSGFNTEYFGGCFTLIFMAEYLSIIFMSYLINIFFISSNLLSISFLFFWMMHIYMIVWIRGVLPRIRYDELMFLCWKKFLSIVLIYIIFVFGMKILLIYKI